MTIPVEEGAYYARESMLHVVHPDTFERIFSRSEKWRLIDALKDVAPEDEDNDRRLWGLRQIIGARVGEDFDWYDTVPACALWRKFDDPWVGYLFWAGRFHGLSTFDRDERDYKLTIAERMGDARTAVLAGDEDWIAEAQARLRLAQQHHELPWPRVLPALGRGEPRGGTGPPGRPLGRGG